MASINFIDGVTKILASWLNDLNRLHYTIFGNPTDDSEARTNLDVYSKAEVDGLVGTGGSSTIFVSSANGHPAVDDSPYSAHIVLTENVWSSFGPTGSGADNEWSALDVIPAGYDWVELRVLLTGESVTDTANTKRTISLWGGEAGKSVPAGTTQALVARGSAYTNSSGNGISDSVVPAVKLPLSAANAFQLYYRDEFNDASPFIQLFFTGYGKNG